MITRMTLVRGMEDWQIDEEVEAGHISSFDPRDESDRLAIVHHLSQWDYPGEMDEDYGDDLDRLQRISDDYWWVEVDAGKYLLTWSKTDGVALYRESLDED